MKPGDVRLEGVWKSFHKGRSVAALRDALPNFARRLIGRSPAHDRELFWALEDINFSVRPGEVLGIIGPNGAGKTTILSLITYILRPNRGVVDVSGRVASLLHLGAMSHGDFTGRENIYMNGVISGMTKAEITRKFDSIVAFSGIDESFIDTPLKRYSTGMYTRLAFSVVVHVEPEVLLVDELLAVGDMGFQQKSFQKIYDLSRSGRTVIFVSHHLGTVEAFADRVLWIEKGKIRSQGTPSEVLNAYLDSYDTTRLAEAQNTRRLMTADGSFEITQVVLKDREGHEGSVFQYGDSLTVEMRFKTTRPIEKPHFKLGVTDGRGWSVFSASMLADGMTPKLLQGEGAIQCVFENLPLLPKVYEVWGSMQGKEGLGDLIDWQLFAAFRVEQAGIRKTFEPAGKTPISYLRTDASCFVPYRWIVE